ncbi:MAG TPA: transcriptional regulator [Gemmatimonadaceae bacterium]|nr:transcriptional regulator [Gemmatimonadaceae bacterium]
MAKPARDDSRPSGGDLRSLRSKGESKQASGRADALDRLIHERLRLGIVSALAVNDTLSFSDLKKLMKTTDGNLSVHARKLEEADYIACTKSFEGRMPRTEYKLTSSGRRALERYLDHMEALIRATRER